MELIFLTGMSGAGKSQAADFLEDQGFFCIDNLPPMILPELVKTFYKGQGGEGFGIEKLVFVVDIRSREFLKGFGAALKKIDEEVGCSYRIIFLEAADDVLVKRYRQSRRKHPLGKDLSLTDAISSERKLLLGIRARATNVIDTSMMALPALRDELLSMIEDDASTGMSVFIESFGFKYGMPVDCDNVLDVRFLPNPFYIDTLCRHSGLDEDVRSFVMDHPTTKEFMQRYTELLDFLIPHYKEEGKRRLVIAIGCTGGAHRSVAIAEAIAQYLRDKGLPTEIVHRDLLLEQARWTTPVEEA